jgi:hypothetical protein
MVSHAGFENQRFPWTVLFSPAPRKEGRSILLRPIPAGSGRFVWGVQGREWGGDVLSLTSGAYSSDLELQIRFGVHCLSLLRVVRSKRLAISFGTVTGQL